MIDEILAYNRAFVTNKGYKPYTTSKYPDRKLSDCYLYGYPFD